MVDVQGDGFNIDEYLLPWTGTMCIVLCVHLHITWMSVSSALPPLFFTCSGFATHITSSQHFLNHHQTRLCNMYCFVMFKLQSKVKRRMRPLMMILNSESYKMHHSVTLSQSNFQLRLLCYSHPKTAGEDLSAWCVGHWSQVQFGYASSSS